MGDARLIDVGQGGPMLWAILALSCAAWATIAWLWLETRSRVRQAGHWRAVLLSRLAEGDRVSALGLCDAGGAPEHAALAQLLSSPEPAAPQAVARARALLDAARRDALRHMPLVGAMGAAALLLGLLGTIFGMVSMFSAVGQVDVQRVESLASGMSQALLTTQAGLLVALPVWVMQRVLNGSLAREGDRALIHLHRVTAALADAAPRAMRASE
jgi:biopolymer transport protein ExbB